LDTITPYAKKLGEYSDDGHYFAGAYGPPFRDQLPYVLYCLRRDSSTRQAVISIWRPRPYESKDIPCTISLQFLLRDNYLNVVATMRSSDAWLGWPYDVHTFSCIGAYIALHLDCELGFLSLTAGSQHLYDTDLDKAKRLLKAAETSPHMEFEWKGMKPDEFIESLWEQARS
jgi:thymidylate synthase